MYIRNYQFKSRNSKKFSIRRDSLDIEGQKEKLWAFGGRLPRKDMKLVEAVKGLVQAFWYDNTRHSSNTSDVLKNWKGSRNHELHIKHYLYMTQTQLYEMFTVSHPELRLGQRSFEKSKPWYVRINTIRNTYCCRYHVEFEYYYNMFLHIHWFLHPNHVHECSSIPQPISSRYFLHTIMCLRRDTQAYYAKKCLDGTCRRIRIIHLRIQLLKNKTSHGIFISYMMENIVGRLIANFTGNNALVKFSLTCFIF